MPLAATPSLLYLTVHAQTYWAVRLLFRLRSRGYGMEQQDAVHTAAGRMDDIARLEARL